MGVIGLTETLSIEVGEYNIRVNALSPGGFLSGQPEKFIERYSARTFLGRMANETDLKGALVFLDNAVDAATGTIALKAEFPNRYVHEDYATTGLAIYTLATGKIADHPNKDLHHLLGLCWSPDSRWFLATVYGGMGYGHTSLAFAVSGTKVFDLHITGCRPDLTLDSKRVAWGSSVAEISIGEMDLTPGKPAIVDRKVFVTAGSGMKVYHVDWSPDGKYLAFSRGPAQPDLGPAPEQLGVKARGWNICVGNIVTGEWVAITTDGNSNKEPDWVPLKRIVGK
jgi:hypothetical protein